MKNPTINELNDQFFDLAIIGGGIVGAGIARDAALRGLSVVLFEKDDFASGTSATSTRLIHGGLRYLEMFDFALVRQDLGERETLLRIAPHLVRPLAFIVPMWKRSIFYRLKLKIGMILYDLLSYDKSLPNHWSWKREELLAKEPQLDPDGLQGAMCYYDAQVPSTERLVMENILDAREHGASIWNHTTVTGLLRDGRRVTGLRAQQNRSGEAVEVRAKLVINAAGPWLDDLNTQLLSKSRKRVRMTKGIHITAPQTIENALVLFARQDNRLFFVIPWQGYSWIGTTDTDYEDSPDLVRANGEDVDYLVDSVESFLPEADLDTIYYTTAGLRALVRKEGVNESAVSRKHALVDYEQTEQLSGLIAIIGGKITAYRDIAEEVVDLACRKLNVKVKTRTDRQALPGANIPGTAKSHQQKLVKIRELLDERNRAIGLSDEQLDHLLHLYGILALKILTRARTEPRLKERIHPDYLDILAQVSYSVEEEYCEHLTDFLFRRTMLGFTQDQGLRAVPVVTQEMAKILHWEGSEKAEEEQHYHQWVARSQAFREERKQVEVPMQVQQQG